MNYKTFLFVLSISLLFVTQFSFCSLPNVKAEDTGKKCISRFAFESVSGNVYRHKMNGINWLGSVSMKTLDIGCGYRPRGDVNIDLYIGKTIHRVQQKEINPKKIRNFVNADSLHLPFKTNGFDNVVSHHVIEHVDNPTLFLKECIRVAKKQVSIFCPHAWARSKLFKGQGEEHKTYFRPRWFHATLKNFWIDVNVTSKPLFHIPFLNWFSEIQLTIYLKKLAGDVKI